ncbi:MAG: hypothetical protein Q7S84_01085 [bacterium]|nr:hypothetical protein [bacterium]
METAVVRNAFNAVADRRGEDRELFVWGVLDFLKSEKVIHEYIPSSHLDSQDRDGIDITVVAIGPSKREVYPIQVTGPLWVEEHYMRNPETPVIVVDLWLGKKTMWRFAFAQLIGVMALATLKEHGLVCDYRVSPKFWWVGTGIAVTFTITLPGPKVLMRQIHLVHRAEGVEMFSGEDRPRGILYVPYHRDLGQGTIQVMASTISGELNLEA